MQLGDFTLQIVSGGTFRIDGGTMFGVVPRVLWSAVFEPDEENRIAQATNCLLIRSQAHTVLVDTGYGTRMSEKQRRRLQAESGDVLFESLAELGVSPEEIDTVILSHLHFDHVGGAVREDEHGQAVPAFPNAAYVVQQGEWERATAGAHELRAAYSAEWVAPLSEAGQLELVDGDVEVRAGSHALVTGGHTRDHQALLIESEGQQAFYPVDICPSTRHLPSLWCLAYDENLLETRRCKSELLGRAADENWLVLFDHDPGTVAARLVRDPRNEFTVAEAVPSL